jgi:hypothetical protein
MKLSTKDLEGGALDLINDVREQLNDPPGQYLSIVDVILAPKPQEVIACEYDWQDSDQTYWSIPYTMNDQGEPVVEMDRAKWEEREVDYVPVGTGTYTDIDDDDEMADDKECDAYVVAATKAELDSGKGSPKRSSLKKSQFAYVDEQSKGHFPIQDAAHVRNALARLDQSPYGPKAKKKVMAAARRFGIKVSKPASKELVPTTTTSSFMSKVMQAIVHLRGKKEVKPFYVTKDASGHMRFFTVMSNNFTDREGELFTASSHKSFIKWCDDQGSYPELWVWHAKGTKFGQVDWMDFVDDGGAGVVASSGLIDPGMEPRAEWLATQDVAMSHGFIGHRTKEGYWTDYVSWEQSVLPREAVANYGTAFNLLTGGKDMAFTKDKLALLSSLPGATEADVKGWEKQTTDLVKNLKSLGIDYKALGADPDPDPQDPPTPGDGTPPQAPEAVLAITKQFLDERNALVGTMKDMADKMVELTARAEAAEKSAAATLEAATKAGVNVEEAIKAGVKDAITPRVAATGGFVASQAPGNTVEGAQKEADTSWFSRGVSKTYTNITGLGAEDGGSPMDKVVQQAAAGAAS